MRFTGEASQKAYAKINLTLNITAKRPDGYHELESVMQSVSLCDDVEVTCAFEIAGGTNRGATHSLERVALRGVGRAAACGLEQGAAHEKSNCEEIIRIFVDMEDDYIATQDIPTDNRNTAYKAAIEYFNQYSLRRNFGGIEPVDNLVPQKIAIRIKKRIPAAAGLAGGSADGAAVLRALNEIVRRVYCDRTCYAASESVRCAQCDRMRCAARENVRCSQCDRTRSATRENMPRYSSAPTPPPLSPDELRAAALRVGADVPFCLSGGTALAAGIGERLTSLPPMIAKYEVVLVNPLAEISTARLFADFSLPDVSEINRLSKLNGFMIRSHGGAMDRCFNVLEAAALSRWRQVKEIKSGLLKAGAVCAAMSGSGPTVFGLFEGDAMPGNAMRDGTASGGATDGGAMYGDAASSVAAFTDAARTASRMMSESGYWVRICSPVN